MNNIAVKDGDIIRCNRGCHYYLCKKNGDALQLDRKTLAVVARRNITSVSGETEVILKDPLEVGEVTRMIQMIAAVHPPAYIPI